MGVCCIVFDIDGMLFEFFMNFFRYLKKLNLKKKFFKISCFLRLSCYLKHLKKLGGGGRVEIFYFLCYFQH